MALEGLHHTTAMTADAPGDATDAFEPPPVGVLFGPATRDIGSAVDEPGATPGERLALRARHESRRARRERSPMPITSPRTAA